MALWGCTIPPYGQDTARRFGVWDCGPGDQRTLHAIVLADRAHILTDLAMQFAPQVNLAHVITTIVHHAIAYPELYQYVRLTPLLYCCGWPVNSTLLAKPSQPRWRVSTPLLWITRTSRACLRSFEVCQCTLHIKPGSRLHSRGSSSPTLPRFLIAPWCPWTSHPSRR